MEFFPESVQQRRKSVPPSTRLCRDGIYDGKLFFTNLPSDASTDAQTDSSTCSESGIKTPLDIDDCFCGEASPALLCWSQEALAQHSWFAQPASTQAEHVPEPPSQIQRLSAKANAFKPQMVSEEPAKQHYQRHFADAIKSAKKMMQASEHVENVEISESATGWSLIIRPNGDGDTEFQAERLLTLAKEALLDAAANSRCIYLMGYCSPKPFTMQAQGFEAVLGAMESPTTACWHVFKKGFCRHGAECCKQHPACKVPVQVLVESAQFNSCASFVGEFKQEVADLTMAVIATLRECSYADQVEAFKDNECQGWTIEVKTKEDVTSQTEYLLTLAKSSLFSATNVSNTAYIMGYAAKPFAPKPQGFVTILGDMQDETRACWDLYSKGVCTRDCACRWQHPECFMPLNVVVKAKPCQDSSENTMNAVLDYLVDDGESRVGRK